MDNLLLSSTMTNSVIQRGKEYKLKFYSRERSDTGSSRRTGVVAYWNGQPAVIINDDEFSNTEFTMFSGKVRSNGSEDVLCFRDIGTADTSAALIDNVSLRELCD
eukprot:TRINITY_DN7059_c0_g1_i1.p1 TRINITY_DN7059_c0_g1~~TRINITY_DN7059_c0_g1_i1.p1  ORF type:complete len:105 (+),score=17.39 TRINITY_DN7059_c0_g1_i1:87-401(+)